MRPVFLPRTLQELCETLASVPEARIFAGGTDLFVQMRTGEIGAPALIGVERIEELKGVESGNGSIRIGPGVTHAELLENAAVREELPILAHAVASLGSPLIRNMGTIGGNICTASPAGDTLPPLYLLDARIGLQSPTGRRELPIGDFITGPGSTALKKDEIVTAIRVKKAAGYTLHHFEKVGQRRSLSCAIASLAALIRISDTGVMEVVRLAWGSVAPTVVTAAGIDALLVGQRLSPSLLEKTANEVRRMVSPIDDIRATAAYRREVAGNLLLRLASVFPGL